MAPSPFLFCAPGWVWAPGWQLVGMRSCGSSGCLGGPCWWGRGSEQGQPVNEGREAKGGQVSPWGAGPEAVGVVGYGAGGGVQGIPREDCQAWVWASAGGHRGGETGLRRCPLGREAGSLWPQSWPCPVGARVWWSSGQPFHGWSKDGGEPRRVPRREKLGREGQGSLPLGRCTCE